MYLIQHQFFMMMIKKSEDVDQEEKETVLRVHSEKLVVAFGIMNTVQRTTSQISKNLRVYGDCHTAIKFISKMSTDCCERFKSFSSFQRRALLLWGLLVRLNKKKKFYGINPLG